MREQDRRRRKGFDTIRGYRIGWLLNVGSLARIKASLTDTKTVQVILKHSLLIALEHDLMLNLSQRKSKAALKKTKKIVIFELKS